VSHLDELLPPIVKTRRLVVEKEASTSLDLRTLTQAIPGLGLLKEEDEMIQNRSHQGAEAEVVVRRAEAPIPAVRAKNA